MQTMQHYIASTQLRGDVTPCSSQIATKSVVYLHISPLKIIIRKKSRLGHKNHYPGACVEV